jgi:HK97 gp10 family phage protein
MAASVRGPVLANAAKAGGIVIEAEAKRRVARKTSTLFRSIHTEVVTQSADSATVSIGTNVEYGPYLEYGTGIHGPKGTEIIIRPKRAGGVLRFTIGNRVVFAREVRSPGMRPRPFLGPAFESKSKEAFETMAKAVWQQVKKAAS